MKKYTFITLTYYINYYLDKINNLLVYSISGFEVYSNKIC